MRARLRFMLSTFLWFGGLAACGSEAARSDPEGGDKDSGPSNTKDAAPGDDAGEVDANVDAASKSVWLDEPSSALPARISELGLYPDPSDTDHVDPRVRVYAPRWPLWSNGADKYRYVLLPKAVDVSDREAWVFPVGTAFFKTFSFGQGKAKRVIETRVLRLTDDGWEFSTYQWDEDGRDALLLDGKKDVPVAVEDGGRTFEHAIPSRLSCRACHESAKTPVLGFGELQLNHVASGKQTELGRFLDVLPGLPDDLDAIDESDPVVRDVLGYLTGNCVHCHNGSTVGPNSVYDLRHEVALANLVNVPTESSASATGIRVAPGKPAESVLIRSLLRDDEEGAKPMPPVGVELRDDAAIELFRGWITGLTSPE